MLVILSSTTGQRYYACPKGEHWMGNKTLISSFSFNHFKDGGEAGPFEFTQWASL